MTSPRYRLCLFLVVSVEIALTWIHPSADAPLHYSRDMSLSVDGYWYLAEAKAWAQGEEARVNRAYRKPLISVPAYLAYRLAGVSIASSRVLNSAASIATLLLLATLIRRRYGEGSALIGAFLFAIDPAWHAYVRSPVIYPCVSFWILASIALAAGAGARRWWAGLAFMAVGVVFLKSIVLLAAPAILMEGFLRIRRQTEWRGPRLGLIAVALAVAGVVSFWAGQALVSRWWHRVAFYMSGGDASWWSQPWSFEERCLFFSAFPLIFLLSALAGVGFIVFAFSERDRGRNLQRMFHLVLWVGLGTFAFARYSPLRYLLGLFPILVYLSVAGLNAIRHIAWRRRLAPRALRGGLAWGCGIVVAIFTLRQYSLALATSPLPAVGVATAGTLLAVVGAVTLSVRATRSSSRPTWFASIWVVLVALVMSLPRWSAILSEPEYTLKRSGEQISFLVPPDARVVGPYAHALSVENSLHVEQISQLLYGGKTLRDVVARRGWTHLVMDRPEDPSVLIAFERDGVSLERIDAFHVRGIEVDVYRIRGISLPRSRFEEARDLFRRGRVRDAGRVFSEVLENFSQCAGAWEGLGRCRLLQGDAAAARECFHEALRHDSGRVSTHLVLLDLYAQNGYRREALRHLRAARSIDLRNVELGQRLDEIESRLAAGRSRGNGENP